MKSKLLSGIAIFLFSLQVSAQQNMVTYAGSSGKETFYDVMQITDGTFIVCGYAEDLSWIPAGVPQTTLTYSGTIPNALGNNRYGFMMHLSNDLQTMLNVVHFPQGAVENIRFIKTNTRPYEPTGDLYISCTTEDTYANDGGYIIAKLNNNFINGIPTALEWFKIVWAMSYAKEMHPWDVTHHGEVYYVSGEAHGYDWSAMYCLDQTGNRKVVENWRTHWLANGLEWKGTPATANPLGSVDSVKWSGIVFKIGGRCELRSWNALDFNTTQPDGNGGTRKGKWPADFLFSTPCDPNSPTALSPGYNGYSPEACCPVWGASSVVVDRRNGNTYLGMNFKSYYNPQNTPDFEPAVIAFDSTGALLWWSRLYHEITPAGDTVGSIPDQYIDALAIDYTNDKLVVVARAHGNNIENLWEGNSIQINPSAYGFQNQFTGTNGNIHESWIGKLRLNDGVITNATFVAELAEGTGGLGTAHADPNLDGWPDPNTGWPDVNTTRIAKNNVKISSTGDVCVAAVGRRTITTANAYQKMVKPNYGGQSCWNSFVRVYDSELHVPKYSSLVVGVWDTLTQAGGGNTELYGVYKTSQGVVAVGHHTADAGGTPNGNPIPCTQVPSWGNASPLNQSAILVYYKANNLINPNDSISASTGIDEMEMLTNLHVYPNPTTGTVHFSLEAGAMPNEVFNCTILDICGRVVDRTIINHYTMNVDFLPAGLYTVIISNQHLSAMEKIIVQH
jgi:hypothetical protein